MRELHPAAWIGLIINGIVMFFAIIYVNEEALYYYEMGYDFFEAMDGIGQVFSLLFISGFLMSLVGVIMLIKGNPAGGVIGAIGGAIYVPIGMICMFGCLQSRSRKMLAAYEAPAAYAGQGGGVVSTEPGRAQAVASRMNAVAVKTLSGDYGQSEAVSGTDGEQSPQGNSSHETPLAIYKFVDQSIWGWVLIGVVIVGAFFLSASDIRIPGTMFVPLAAAIPMLIGYRRARNFPVFALYENALELTTNMYATPIRIQYSDILGVEIKRNAAKLEVRRPDGSIDKKLTVAFSFIAGSERKEAKRIFEKKMCDLGLMK